MDHVDERRVDSLTVFRDFADSLVKGSFLTKNYGIITAIIAIDFSTSGKYLDNVFIEREPKC